jgi:uncharacterized membrane protein YraQ (UPF0718 family)
MKTPSCCAPEGEKHTHKFDYIFYGSGGILLAAIAAHFIAPGFAPLDDFALAAIGLIETMWWGVLLGMFFVGLMSKVPREYFQSLMGRGDTLGGLVRAALAGVLLDLCSHGILLIAAKLYERGVSLPQVMTFLIASPWNSFSLTIILFTLIGVKWTLIFIAASCVVAFLSGFIFIALTRRGIIAPNPHTTEISPDFSLVGDAKERLKNFRPGPKFFGSVIKAGTHEGQMLVRWLLLGVVIASALQAFIPADTMGAWFGPTLLGLGMTLVMATVIEVCSEGSAPIASVIMNQAGAPGNAFAFLMAGVATDYTEMMILRQMTGSWRVAIFMPIITLPQIILIGMIMNVF